jgi:hypothetical protein
MGSADHQRNLARNAYLPRPRMTLFSSVPIAPQERTDNRFGSCFAKLSLAS